MFIGHYGVSFAVKPLANQVPLWVWFVATQWLDVVWSILILLGVERMRVISGYTEANAYDLYYMPYTHGLLGSLVLSLVLGATIAAFVPGHRVTTAALVAAASFSHWLLDLVVHVPDLPLYGNLAKVGFGLWRHVTLSFPLELIILGIGAWLHARGVKFNGRRGKLAYCGLVFVLAITQIYANCGPPPPSPQFFAIFALSLYVIMALLAALVERSAIAKQAGP